MRRKRHVVVVAVLLAALCAAAGATVLDANAEAPVLSRTPQSSEADLTPVVVVQWRDAEEAPRATSPAAALAAAAAAPPPTTPDVAALLPGAELVTPQPGVSAPSAASRASSSGAPAATSPDDIFATRFGILRYGSTAEAQAAVDAFAAGALPAGVYGAVAGMSVSSRARTLEIPDPECAPSGLCPALWGMEKMRVASVWKRLAAVPAAGAAATARSAVVIDTGVSFDHFDFASGGPDGSPTIARDDSATFNAPRYPMSATPGFDDGNGHGTHVAGTMAGGWGAGDDRGIAGVVGRARVVSCRFLADYTPREDGGSSADAARCIQHATSKKAFVINASYGGPLVGGDYAANRQAVLDFCASGGVLVAAAGNDGMELGVGYPNYPAQFAGTPGMECVVPVAAVARNDTLARWSNWGKRVKLAAPGVGIASDWIPGAGVLASLAPPSVPELAGTSRAWTTISGTSMASPHVAGAVLLLGNAFPAASNLDVIACLVATATRPATASPLNGAQYISGGIVDVDAAYACLQTKASGTLACAPERLTVRLRRKATGCDGLASLPDAAFVAPSAADVAVASPAGPYAPGDHAVTVTVGAASCTVKLTVQPCGLECGGPFEEYQGKGNYACPALMPLPEGTVPVWAPPGVSFTLDKPGPYPTGTNVIRAVPADPAREGCSFTYTIYPCRLRCGAPVTASLASSGGRCLAAVPFPVNGCSGPPGVTASYSPAGPYAAGNYTLTATPSNGAAPSEVRLVVPPCVVAGPTCSPVVADLRQLGRCAQGTLASLPSGAVSTPSGVRVTLSPKGPWRPGQYSVVATPDNGGSPCTVDLTVVACGATPAPPPPPPPSGPCPGDAEAPTLADTQVCLYPDKASGSTATYSPATKCFSPAELIGGSVADNCGTPGQLRLRALSCANVSPAAGASGACRVTTASGGATSVCVSLRGLPAAAGTPRVVRARLQASDAAGNAAVATAEIRVFRARGADPACLIISRATARVGGTSGPAAPPAPPAPPARRRGFRVRSMDDASAEASG